MEQICQYQRTRNVGRNVIYGLLNRFVSLLLPFIVRTIIIYRFGALYLGMNSLLSSIFQVLNLVEFGFGTAVVYCLYKPVAEGDTDTVCAYLGSYRIIYRVIGLVIFGVGLTLMPFFPYILKDSTVPGDVNLFFWYLIILTDAVVSYLLYGYKTAIPMALQREDLLRKIDTAVMIGKCFVQIGCLFLSDNFYWYLCSTLVFTVVRNLLVSYVVDKCYPDYICRGHINSIQLRNLKCLVGGLFLSNVRSASRHALDSICITVFVSLTLTAIYSNYFLILTSVISISGILSGAMVASVGNSIVTESREKNYRDMRRFNYMYMLVAGWAMICMLCLYQPFVRLWVGPDLMLGQPEMMALCLYYYLLKAGDIRWIYHQGAGLWWKARYIVVAEIICNIVLNVIMAKFWSVLGIISATLISLFFVNFLGGAWILFKEYFQNGKLWEFFIDQALYFGVTCVLAALCFLGCERVTVWLSAEMKQFIDSGLISMLLNRVTESGLNIGFGISFLLVRLFFCTIVTVTGYYFVYFQTNRFKDAKRWLQSRYKCIIN